MAVTISRRLCLACLIFLHQAAVAGDSYERPELSQLRLNELQYIGAHNSYHIEPDQTVDLLLLANQYGDDKWPATRLVRALTYTHYPLEVQLELGIRSFELDLYADPQGGRYASPGIFSSIDEKGLLPKTAYDPDKVLIKPGFKVFHMQDIDVRSHCLIFKGCLSVIANWSSRNPGHLPVIIQLEPKEGERQAVDGHYQPVHALEFTQAVWYELEQEILSVIPRDKLIAPDDVMGEYGSLRVAIKRQGWPLVDQLRGKFLFILIHPGEATERYVGEDDSLKGQLFFANLLNSNRQDSSFMMYTKPYKPKQHNMIRHDAKQGYLVYTRADAHTEEARRNDPFRRAQAFSSGAHIISTDYPFPDYRFSDYKVQFPGGVFVRCNPVTAKARCK